MSPSETTHRFMSKLGNESHQGFNYLDVKVKPGHHLTSKTNQSFGSSKEKLERHTKSLLNRLDSSRMSSNLTMSYRGGRITGDPLRQVLAGSSDVESGELP